MMHTIPAAAIVYSGHGVADKLLADFAVRLRAQGRRVQGLVQQQFGGSGKAATMLVDLDGGQRFPLFQHLGAGSSSCCLDQSSVVAASGALRRALDDRPDLAFANRFGALEANGDGLAADMLALLAEGIPLITVVADDYLEDWRAFTGKAGAELPPAMEALENWFAGIRQETRP